MKKKMKKIMKTKKKIEIKKKNCVFVETKEYDVLAKDGNFIEVTEWTNGDGFDIHNSREGQTMNLTWGEFDAVKKLVKTLSNEQFS